MCLERIWDTSYEKRIYENVLGSVCILRTVFDEGKGRKNYYYTNIVYTNSAERDNYFVKSVLKSRVRR